MDLDTGSTVPEFRDQTSIASHLSATELSSFRDSVQDESRKDGLLPSWVGSLEGGPLGRLGQLLVSLATDPDVSMTVRDHRAFVSKADLRLCEIAKRCDVRSSGSAGEWRRAWVAAGWLTGSVFDLDAIAVGAGVDPIDSAVVTAPRVGSSLGSVGELLDRLEAALAAGHDRYAAILERWIEPLLISGVAVEDNVDRGFADTGRETAVQEPAFAVDSRELVSSSNSISTTNSTTAAASGPRKNRGSRRIERTNEEFLLLVEPLVRLARERSLTAITNSGAIKAVLAEYSDEQVVEAVRAMCRHVRADGSVRSPFGLLFTAARDANPDFFAAENPSSLSPVSTASGDGSTVESQPGTSGPVLPPPLARAEVLARIRERREQIR